MIRRRHLRHKNKAPVELEITAFMNLMVILVPFLLITAVFSRITVLDLYLPPDSDTQNNRKPEFQLEVTISKASVDLRELSTKLHRSFPIKNDHFNVQDFSKAVEALKANFRSKRDAAIMADQDVSYDMLVKVMDRVRVREVRQNGRTEFIELFPNISIGDASGAKG